MRGAEAQGTLPEPWAGVRVAGVPPCEGHRGAGDLGGRGRLSFYRRGGLCREAQPENGREAATARLASAPDALAKDPGLGLCCRASDGGWDARRAQT